MLKLQLQKKKKGKLITISDTPSTLTDNHSEVLQVILAGAESSSPSPDTTRFKAS